MARERVMEEVGSLLGVSFDLSESVHHVIAKGEYFSELDDKKIIAKLDIIGDIEGLGGILVSIKDAIRLGGTLIMLPTAELDQVVSSENYSEEIEDSYGEIANIIAGSYTKAFEDAFPKDCRLIRKEQEAIVPLKVEISSAEPIPDQIYYVVRSTMKLGDQEMGEIDVLLPAVEFGIEMASENTAKPEDSPLTEHEIAATTSEADGDETETGVEEDEGAEQQEDEALKLTQNAN